jgi:hypothetical protein
MKNSFRKSFELEDDICNLYSEAEKNKNVIPNHNSMIKLQKSASKRSNSRNNNSRISRNSTKDSPMNLSVQTGGNTNLLELVDSLKDKLALYENEIKSLLDEKVQMQLQLNNLQLTARKKGRSSSISNNESIAELNKQYVREASGLNKELKVLDENIQRQRNLIEQNYSILDDTITDQRVNNEIELKVKINR